MLVPIRSLPFPGDRAATLALLVALALAAAACPGSQPAGAVGDGRPDLGFSDSGARPDGTGTVPPSDCSSDSTLIYAGSGIDDSLRRFDPRSGALTVVGKVSCGQSGSPLGLSVDRQGYAWILYRATAAVELVKVRTSDAGCALRLPLALETGDDVMSISFVGDAATPGQDALYAALYRGSDESMALGRVDLGSGAVTRLGALPVIANPIGGTPNGRLLTIEYPEPYNPNGPPRKIDAVERDVSTRAELARHTFTVDAANFPTGVVFWGGSAWIFVIAASEETSQLLRLDLATGATTTVNPGIGFLPRGAGSSTCVPLTIK